MPFPGYGRTCTGPFPTLGGTPTNVLISPWSRVFGYLAQLRSCNCPNSKNDPPGFHALIPGTCKYDELLLHEYVMLREYVILHGTAGIKVGGFSGWQCYSYTSP